MTLYCDACEVAWDTDESTRCWLCGTAGLPYIPRLTSGRVLTSHPLAPMPGDTQDKVVFP